MQIQLGDGTIAEIASIENIDLDTEVVYFEGERLRKAAHQAGVSESELAREAIDDYLAKDA